MTNYSSKKKKKTLFDVKTRLVFLCLSTRERNEKKKKNEGLIALLGQFTKQSGAKYKKTNASLFLSSQKQFFLFNEKKPTL